MLEQKQERAAALPREAEKKAIKALQKELAALQQPLREVPPLSAVDLSLSLIHI